MLAGNVWIQKTSTNDIALKWDKDISTIFMGHFTVCYVETEFKALKYNVQLRYFISHIYTIDSNPLSSALSSSSQVSKH